MRRVTWLAILAVACWAGAAGAAQPRWQWYVVGKDKNVQVNMYLFWSRTCPRCEPARAFTKYLKEQYGWLRVYEHEITTSWENLELYRQMAGSLNQPAGQTPAFFYAGRMHLGYDSYQQTGRAIEQQLVYTHRYLQDQIKQRQARSAAAPLMAAVHGLPLLVVPGGDGPPDTGTVFGAEAGEPPEAAKLPEDLQLPDPGKLDELQPQRPTVEVPFWGEVDTAELALPALTVVIASCDAFNPCAFFVLLSLLSLMVHAHSRRRMLLVGGIFIFFSGFFYFLFMAAWLNVFLIVGQIRWITAAAGGLAVAVALINVKDYFWWKQGVSLSIPEGAKPGLFQRMRYLLSANSVWPMLAGTVALAVAANTYELLCTAGFPMVYTRALTLRELPAASYYGYLALYNVIYVIPLALIVVVFTFTLGSRKLQEHEGRFLKLLSGNMMLLLGLILLFRPDWLQSVLTAVLTLAAAGGLTASLALVQFLRQRRTRSGARRGAVAPAPLAR